MGKRFHSTCISCDSVISPYVSYCEACYHDIKSGYIDEARNHLSGSKAISRAYSDDTVPYEGNWEDSHFNRNG